MLCFTFRRFDHMRLRFYSQISVERIYIFEHFHCRCAHVFRWLCVLVCTLIDLSTNTLSIKWTDNQTSMSNISRDKFNCVHFWNGSHLDVHRGALNYNLSNLFCPTEILRYRCQLSNGCFEKVWKLMNIAHAEDLTKVRTIDSNSRCSWLKIAEQKEENTKKVSNKTTQNRK